MTQLNKIKQLIEQNNFSEAEKKLNKFLLYNPENTEWLLILAGLYRAAGRSNEAKKTYSRILEINNTDTIALRLLIDFLDENELKDYTKKIDLLISKGLSDEKKIDLYFSLAILNERLEKYRIASEYFIKANNLKRKINPYNFDHLNKHFQNLKSVYHLYIQISN